MNEALCQKFGAGAFPTAADLAQIEVQTLQEESGVGYRAKSIIKLAQQVWLSPTFHAASTRAHNPTLIGKLE